MRNGLAGIRKALQSRSQKNKKHQPRSKNVTVEENDPLSVFERQYDPRMGHFYTCPCCYRRYVSSECVEEHLIRCAKRALPKESSLEKIPQIVSYSSVSSNRSDGGISDDHPSTSSTRSYNNNCVQESMLEVCMASPVLSDSLSDMTQEADGEIRLRTDIMEEEQQEEEMINGDISQNELISASQTEGFTPFSLGNYFVNAGGVVVPLTQVNTNNNDDVNIFGLNSVMSSVNSTSSVSIVPETLSEVMPTVESSYGGYSCPTCNGHFETIEGLQAHLVICINTSTPLQLGDEFAMNSGPTSISVAEQPPYSAAKPMTPSASSLSVRSDEFQLPTPVIRSDGFTVYPCESCKMAFKTPEEYRDHHALKHATKHTCTICGKIFKEKRGLKHHERIHAGVKAFKCPFCDETFFYASTMNAHKLIHKECPPLNCDFPGCNAAFRNLWTYKRHRGTHKVLPVLADGNSSSTVGNPVDQGVTEKIKKKITKRRSRRRSSESPDPPSPVEVITLD